MFPLTELLKIAESVEPGLLPPPPAAPKPVEPTAPVPVLTESIQPS